MTGPDSTRPLHGPQGLGDPSHNRTHESGASDPTAFRRLLERLESVARPVEKGKGGEADSPSDLHALHDALHDADRDYEQLMELRRQLEQAFRHSGRSTD